MLWDILAPLIFVGGLFCIGCIITFIVYYIDHEEKKTVRVNLSKTYEIYSLKDNTKIEGQISGSVFAINGYINQRLVYYVYKKDGDGYSRTTLNGNAKIFEDTENGGYVKENWNICPKVYIKQHFFADKDPVLVNIEIHIPKGTLIKQFKLDNE